MASKFKPMTLDKIDEGRFLKDVEDEMATAIERLIKFTKKFGPDLTKKAKAVLNARITIVFEGRDENDFSIKAQVSHTVPSKPPSVSIAMAAPDDAEKDVLFVRASGSTEEHPTQGVLCTKDGKTVDVTTGEIKK